MFITLRSRKIGADIVVYLLCLPSQDGAYGVHGSLRKHISLSSSNANNSWALDWGLIFVCHLDGVLDLYYMASLSDTTLWELAYPVSSVFKIWEECKLANSIYIYMLKSAMESRNYTMWGSTCSTMPYRKEKLGLPRFLQSVLLTFLLTVWHWVAWYSWMNCSGTFMKFALHQ